MIKDRRMRREKIVIAVAAALSAAAPARAQTPVAIVEDLTGQVAGVEIMDYLAPGKRVEVGAGSSIVIGYLRSCIRETVSGGHVVVGAEESAGEGAKIVRERVECDGGRMRLSADQAAKSGVMVFRAPPRAQSGAMQPDPEVVLYGLSPVVTLPGGGDVVIERLDRPGERIAFTVGAKALTRAPYFDLAKQDRALAAGGLYRATGGDKEIVFRVDPNAKAGQGPIVARLLRF